MSSQNPGSSDGTDGGVARPGARPPGAPRWVKVCAVIAGVVLVLLVVVKLTGTGGEHGPGRHMGAGRAQSTVVVEYAGFGGPMSGTSSWG
jgi:hypothetical protein